MQLLEEREKELLELLENRTIATDRYKNRINLISTSTNLSRPMIFHLFFLSLNHSMKKLKDKLCIRGRELEAEAEVLEKQEQVRIE